MKTVVFRAVIYDVNKRFFQPMPPTGIHLVKQQPLRARTKRYLGFASHSHPAFCCCAVASQMFTLHIRKRLVSPRDAVRYRSSQYSALYISPLPPTFLKIIALHFSIAGTRGHGSANLACVFASAPCKPCYI